MKKTVKFLVFISLIVFFASCSKDNDVSDNTSYEGVSSIIEQFYQSDKQPDGKIFMVNDYMQTMYDTFSTSFAFQGYFPEGTAYSNVSYNQYVIPIESNKYYSSNTIDSINLQGNMSHYFGSSNSIKIDGSTFVNDFYVPSPIVVDFPNSNNFTFNKSQGISINFSVDAKNVNPIILVLEYVPDNAVEGDVILTKSYYLDSQIKNFLIPSGDLAEFPSGEKLILYVGCGNGKLVNFNNKSYNLEGINITYLPHIQLY